MSFDWSCGELAEGLRCYRKREFFEAHEHWEIVWLQCTEPEKTFLQALIQITAAFHHLQRKNAVGTASLLRGAARRLAAYPAVFGGIDVAPLRDELCLWLRALDLQEHPSGLDFPRISELRGQAIRGDGSELPDGQV